MPPSNDYNISVTVNHVGTRLDAASRNAVNDIVRQTGATVRASGPGTIAGRDATVSSTIMDERGIRAAHSRLRARAVRAGVPWINNTAVALASQGNVVAGSNVIYNVARDLEPEFARASLTKAQNNVSRLRTTRLTQADRYQRMLDANPGLASSPAFQNAISNLQSSAAAGADNSVWAENMRELNTAHAAFRADVQENGPASRGGIRNRRKFSNRTARGITDLQEFARTARNLNPAFAGVMSSLQQQQAAHAAIINQPNVSRADLNRAQDMELRIAETRADAERMRRTNLEGERGLWGSRGSALGWAMAARGGLSRLSGFGQSVMTSQGDALHANTLVGGVKTLTGIGTDVATNAFIQRPTGAKFGALLGIGIIDSIVGAIQAGVQRGLDVRRRSTESARGQELTLSEALVTSTSRSIPGSRFRTPTVNPYTDNQIDQALDAVGKHNEKWYNANIDLNRGFDSIRWMTPADQLKFAPAFFKKGGEADLNREQKLLRSYRYMANLTLAERWGGAVSEKDMYNGLNTLSNAGVNARRVAQVEGFGGFPEGVAELLLGSDVAGLSAKSGIKADLIASMMQTRALGFGSGGIQGARALTGMVQRNVISSSGASRIAELGFESGSQGANVDWRRETGFINSLASNGVAPGQVSNVWAALQKSGMSASKKLTAGFDGVLDSAAMVKALQQTSDPLEAAQIAKDMSNYDRLQASRELMGDYLTQGGLQAEGVSRGNAMNALGAGPEGTGETSVLSGWKSAYTATLNELRSSRKLMGTEHSVSEQNRNAAIQASLEAASAALLQAATDIARGPSGPE